MAETADTGAHLVAVLQNKHVTMIECITDIETNLM